MQLATVTLGHLVVDMNCGFLFPLIPLLVKRFGVELTSVTLLVGICGLIVNATQPVAGILTKKFSRHVFLLIAPLLAGLVACVGLTEDIWLFAGLAMVSHVAIGMFHPDGLMAAHVLSGTKEHIGIPIFMSGGFFGFSAGALASSLWVTNFGFDGIWLLTIPGVLIAALNILTGLHDKQLKTRTKEHITTSTKGDVNLWMLLILGILLAAEVTTYGMYLAADLKSKVGLEGVKWAGYTITIICLSAVAGSFLWGYLSSRFSSFALTALGQIACVPLYWFLVKSNIGWPMVLLGIATGLFFGGAFFPLIATTAQRSKKFSPSIRAGLIVGGSWGTGSLVASACGYLLDLKMTTEQIMLGMEITIALAAVIAMVMYCQERKVMKSAASQTKNDV